MQVNRPIFISVFFFITILLVIFFVMPEYKNFKSLQADLIQKTAELNAEGNYYDAITKTYLDLQNHKSDLQKVDSALPTDPSIGGIIYFLQGNATQNGLTVNNLFLSQPALNNAQGNPTSNIKSIVFLMSLSGDYPSLEQFIISLEQSARLFEITSISFGSPAQTTSGSYQNQTQAAPLQSQFQAQQPTNFNLQITTHSY